MVRQQNNLVIKALIKPGSRKGPLVDMDSEGLLTLYIREPAKDGLANKAAIELLAKHFKVAKSRVSLVKGFTGRYKKFDIS